MNDLWAGMLQAFWMVASFDQELVEITLLSLQVTLIALLMGTSIALPLAALEPFFRFPPAFDFGFGAADIVKNESI